MKCERCRSKRVYERITDKIRRQRSLRRTGTAYKVCRCILTICTLGLWQLVPKKTVKVKEVKYHVYRCYCMSCGHEWKIGKDRKGATMLIK